MSYDPEYHRLYYLAHKKRIAERQKERLKDPAIRAEKTRRDGKRKTERKRVDVNFRLAINLRSRLNNALKGSFKAGSSVSDLGCSIPELRVYLEARFAQGMSWDNYGQWHIDHVKPLAKFDLTDREQFLQACHYTNLQPLWMEENVRKGAQC